MFKTATIILLGTEKGSSICFNFADKHFFYDDLEMEVDPSGRSTFENKFMYIVNNESIQAGDYFIVEDTLQKCNQVINGMIHFNDGEEVKICPHKFQLKVIASSDKSLGLPLISVDFIKQYVKQNQLTNIMVEYGESFDKQGNFESYYLRTVNNEIIIRPAKETYTKEEMYQAYMKGRDHEYEVSQFIPDGKTECKFAIPNEAFADWINGIS